MRRSFAQPPRARCALIEAPAAADDPGQEFAHGCVRIRVGAASNRNHRRKFRVAKTRKRAADAGNDERENHRWTRAISNRGRGADKQTRANNATNAERDEIDRPERAFQAVLTNFLRFCHQPVERLSRE